MRQRLAGWAQEWIRPRAWVLDDTGFVKDGQDSPGVARMYSGTLGKTGNCQIGVSLHAVTDWASAAVNWRLFLPQSWDDACLDGDEAAERVRQRRARCRIPGPVRYREKWRLALDMLEQAHHDWALDPLPVVADIGYGSITQFRCARDHRGRDYVVAVKAGTSVYPADAQVTTPEWCGSGRRPQSG